MQVVITTAIELSSTQLKKITTALEKQYGKLIVETKIDPSVIGGIKLRIGTSTYDSTLRSKLDKLRDQLTNQLV